MKRNDLVRELAKHHYWNWLLPLSSRNVNWNIWISGMNHHFLCLGDGSGDGDECAGTCQSANVRASILLCGRGFLWYFLCVNVRVQDFRRVCGHSTALLYGRGHGGFLLCVHGRDGVLLCGSSRDEVLLCGNGHGRTLRLLSLPFHQMPKSWPRRQTRPQQSASEDKKKWYLIFRIFFYRSCLSNFPFVSYKVF